jgi:putative copper resistance protein D
MIGTVVLVVVRALHFAGCIALAGTFAASCLVIEPALRRDRGFAAASGIERRLRDLAWASLALALVSGAGWLVSIAGEMSGQPLSTAVTSGAVGIVLNQTRIGQDWLLRAALAVPLGACLVFWERRGGAVARWIGFALAALILVTLAWAGHGASDEGVDGVIHLAADLCHLLAAGLWLGGLVPFALLLAAARRIGDTDAVVTARNVTRRFSVLAVTGVAVLLASGMVNTWYLAGNAPALLGTTYGRLLLVKIGLFAIMLLVAAINRLRLTPRLDDVRAPRAITQLQRSALFETAIGLGVLGIVGLLGIMPPGLHTEPVWPLPFRIDPNALTTGARVVLALFATLLVVSLLTTVVALITGRKRLMGAAVIGLIVAIAFGGAPVRPALVVANPTTYFAPPVPYDAAAVIAGQAVYLHNCTECHGVDGSGDGPLAAKLPIKPADLLLPHLFAHTVGDLYWWIGHGLGGVMPPFASVLTPTQRWDVIHFIRARAAGVQTAAVGPTVSGAATPQLLDFAYENGGAQHTLSEQLKTGPALIILYTPPAPLARLQQLSAARSPFAAVGLTVIAVGLGSESWATGARPPYVVGVSPEVAATLAMFRSPDDGGETELMLDRNANIRARWTARDLAAPAQLLADAKRAAQFAVAAPNHAGHGG